MLSTLLLILLLLVAFCVVGGLGQAALLLFWIWPKEIREEREAASRRNR